jgi:leucyl/phenylalanyl-tRNA--protein transferase
LPHPSLALPDGLLAVGGDLSIARLTEAYSKGIFTWFNEGDPVLWWSLDPRMVLPCAEFSPSHSLRKKLRQLGRDETTSHASVQIRVDTAFADVMAACAAPRSTQAGTWISPDIQAAYFDWHQAGQVHSVETWMDGQLVGGLYGVSLGGIFCGESMFSLISDASKLALAYLVRFLIRNNVRRIDCQQQTRHLASLGARPIKRADFLLDLEQAMRLPSPPWTPGRLLQSGELAPR